MTTEEAKAINSTPAVQAARDAVELSRLAKNEADRRYEAARAILSEQRAMVAARAAASAIV